jgi:hypothetical protein
MANSAGGNAKTIQPGINGRMGEHIPEEQAIGVCVGAVEDDMCAPNHR